MWRLFGFKSPRGACVASPLPNNSNNPIPSSNECETCPLGHLVPNRGAQPTKQLGLSAQAIDRRENGPGHLTFSPGRSNWTPNSPKLITTIDRHFCSINVINRLPRPPNGCPDCRPTSGAWAGRGHCHAHEGLIQRGLWGSVYQKALCRSTRSGKWFGRSM